MNTKKARKETAMTNRLLLSLLSTLTLGTATLYAASGEDATYKNMTLEERLYLYNGYGDQWGMDVGNDGLWFAPKRPMGDTYDAPVKIRNGAATNSLVVGNNDESNATSGYVGIGTASPESPLDVKGTINASFEGALASDLNTLFKISTNNSDTTRKSDPGFVIENAREGFSWTFRTWEPDSGFVISKQNSGAKEMIITGADEPEGMELILGNGAMNIGGQWLDASSRSLKENIAELDTQTALEAFNKLKPVTYNYKVNKEENIVGFIAEDVPDIVATNDRKALSALEMVALLTKVVQEQEKELKDQSRKIDRLESLLETLPIKNH